MLLAHMRINMYRVSHTLSFLFFFNDTPPSEIYTLSLHDALPICTACIGRSVYLALTELASDAHSVSFIRSVAEIAHRSEEHTSELQSRFDLVCRLLLEKKKKKNIYTILH